MGCRPERRRRHDRGGRCGAGRPRPNAFVASRPPGHHAERTRAMGFCYLRQRRHRRTARAGTARPDARRGRRFRRAPRQRHAGHPVGRAPHALRLQPPDAALSRHRCGLGTGRVEQHPQPAPAPRLRRRADASIYESRVFPAAAGLRPRSHPRSPPVSTPIATIRWQTSMWDETDFAWLTREICTLADELATAAWSRHSKAAMIFRVGRLGGRACDGIDGGGSG
jgi:hypothetical protein